MQKECRPSDDSGVNQQIAIYPWTNPRSTKTKAESFPIWYSLKRRNEPIISSTMMKRFFCFVLFTVAHLHLRIVRGSPRSKRSSSLEIGSVRTEDVSLFRNDRMSSNHRGTERNVRTASSVLQSRHKKDSWSRHDDEEDHLQSSLASYVSGRRACGFYLWDAPSALLHKWCHHLMKDCVIEGRGGKKFVRVQPGSMLQLLYPCSRYSPDRCLICGGTFRDHLTLWWSKNLYTPFDRLVDKMQEECVEVKTDSSLRKEATRMAKGRSYSSLANEETSKTEFAFHQRYVIDRDFVLKRAQSPSKGKMMIKEELKKRGIASNQTFEVMTVRANNMTYMVPSAETESGKPLSLPLQFARTLLLKAVEGLIFLENSERDSQVDS